MSCLLLCISGRSLSSPGLKKGLGLRVSGQGSCLQEGALYSSQGMQNRRSDPETQFAVLSSSWWARAMSSLPPHHLLTGPVAVPTQVGHVHDK